MHILHVITGDLWAGAESQLFYTLCGIRRRSNHSISVILFNRSDLYHRLREQNLNVTVIDEEKYSSHVILRRLSRFISKNGIDILHTHEYKSHVLGVLAKIIARKNCPVIRTLHGRTSVPFVIGAPKSYAALQIDNIFLRFFTSHIIAVSNDLKEELERIYSRPAIHHISNAVDVALQEVRGHDTIRREMDVSDSCLWIVTAARLVNVKNIDLLIDAVRLIEKKNSFADYTVSIFGDGELRQSLEEKVRKYSLKHRIQFHGHHNNILAVFRAADIFTLTSHHEGLPMSLLEAMSLGAVPVCTAVGGMREVIRNGENGFLVNPGNPGDLAEALYFIINNRASLKSLRQNAIRTIADNYSLEKSTARLLDLYTKITKTR